MDMDAEKRKLVYQIYRNNYSRPAFFNKLKEGHEKLIKILKLDSRFIDEEKIRSDHKYYCNEIVFISRTISQYHFPTLEENYRFIYNYDEIYRYHGISDVFIRSKYLDRRIYSRVICFTNFLNYSKLINPFTNKKLNYSFKELYDSPYFILTDSFDRVVCYNDPIYHISELKYDSAYLVHCPDDDKKLYSDEDVMFPYFRWYMHELKFRYCYDFEIEEDYYSVKLNSYYNKYYTLVNNKILEYKYELGNIVLYIIYIITISIVINNICTISY